MKMKEQVSKKGELKELTHLTQQHIPALACPFHFSTPSKPRHPLPLLAT